MRHHRFFPILLASLLGTVTAAHAAGNEAALKADAVSLVKQFAGQLKPRLKQAMQEGGPVHAVSVCSEAAPAIARALSEESGWQIKRVSLKARNPNALPDTLERRVLEDFDARRAVGESPETLAYSAEVDGEYRFMKAQPTEGLCLACHGSEVAPDVEAALAKYYPNDQARGYQLGDIRGAFSLRYPVK